MSPELVQSSPFEFGKGKRTERYRVWADIHAGTSEEAEGVLRSTLDARKVAFGATGKAEYNGWINYETWCVHLWLTNEQESYERLVAMGRQARADAKGIGRESTALHNLAGEIQAWVNDLLPDLGASLAEDLLNAAVGEVDWHEIAANIMSEVDE